MSPFVLIILVSAGVGNASYGGPVAIEMPTMDVCQVTGGELRRDPLVTWSTCVDRRVYVTGLGRR